MKPGIYDGMPNDEYHGLRDWLGSTSLKTLAMKTPAHYQHSINNRIVTNEFTIGTAAHSLILEDDTTNIVVLDFPNYLTKTAKEAKNAVIAENKQPLLPKEWDVVQAMRDAVMTHPVARKLFTGHVPERSYFWEQGGMRYKCRPDALHYDKIVDLKTTLTADPNDFGRRAFDLGYFISAAHYQAGIKHHTGDDLPFIFVNVEKTEPHLVSVIELDEDALDMGRMMIERAARIYKECSETGVWPGYPSKTTTGLPVWACNQIEELETPEISFG